MNVEEIRYAIINRIIEKTETIFEWLDIEIKRENVVVDSSNSTENELEAEFHLTNIQNVKRNMFDEVVDFLLDGEKDIQFTLQKKRAGHNISFHLKYKQ